MAKSETSSSQVEQKSLRKRITIPKADVSVLEWWSAQADPALSLRLLIRAEIARSGIVDVAFQPVTQQARRGRPPTDEVSD